MNETNKQMSASSSFENTIPASARKALVEYWGNEHILNHPEIIAELGPVSISKINRIGRKSLRRIAEALDRFGYIESSGKWLSEKK